MVKKKTYPKVRKFSKIFDTLKDRIIESELTLNEICNNANINADLLDVLLDNSNNVVNDIERLFDFLKISLLSRSLEFKCYTITLSKTINQIKITRLIKPKCHAYYDIETSYLYKFYSRTNIREFEKQLIINQFYKKIDDYIEEVSKDM